MKPLWISSGEPAGVGPDICLSLADAAYPVVVMGDINVLRTRAELLKYPCTLIPYEDRGVIEHRSGVLSVAHFPCPMAVSPGQLDSRNSSYVMDMLKAGVARGLSGDASGLVTAPVHKAVINQAGIAFTGHTEWLARQSQTKKVAMLLVSPQMRVSLVTTHLPLSQVATAITYTEVYEHIQLVYKQLQRDFGISHPRVKVAGLNPHAGEGGYLGHEEITVIRPVIECLQKQGMRISGPYSADTLFLESENCDVLVTMYHDQGLPVLKYAGFSEAVNVTCGLPFIRTSVDHGTALSLAGTGKASPASLRAAVALATAMVQHRASQEEPGGEG